MTLPIAYGPCLGTLQTYWSCAGSLLNWLNDSPDLWAYSRYILSTASGAFFKQASARRVGHGEVSRHR